MPGELAAQAADLDVDRAIVQFALPAGRMIERPVAAGRAAEVLDERASAGTRCPTDRSARPAGSAGVRPIRSIARPAHQAGPSRGSLATAHGGDATLVDAAPGLRAQLRPPLVYGADRNVEYFYS